MGFASIFRHSSTAAASTVSSTSVSGRVCRLLNYQRRKSMHLSKHSADSSRRCCGNSRMSHWRTCHRMWWFANGYHKTMCWLIKMWCYFSAMEVISIDLGFIHSQSSSKHIQVELKAYSSQSQSIFKSNSNHVLIIKNHHFFFKSNHHSMSLRYLRYARGCPLG